MSFKLPPQRPIAYNMQFKVDLTEEFCAGLENEIHSFPVDQPANIDKFEATCIGARVVDLKSIEVNSVLN